MGKEYYCPYGYCLDIHKSLIPEIRNSFQFHLKMIYIHLMITFRKLSLN